MIEGVAGKSVVVTGAGGGLGRAYAVDLAAAGASVVVNDIDGDAANAVVEETVDTRGRAVAQQGTVAEWGQAGAIIEAALSAFGRLDGLVINAGIFDSTHPTDETVEQADNLVAVNFLGTLYCGLHAIPHMVQAGSGSIVNDTSGGHFGMAGRATYGATKGATASLSYCWAADLAQSGVRVNTVSPIARTGMVTKSEHATGPGAITTPPERIARLVTYLMSDDAAGVTGNLFRFDGPELSALSKPGAVRQTETADLWDQTALFEAIPRLIENLQGRIDTANNAGLNA